MLLPLLPGLLCFAASTSQSTLLAAMLPPLGPAMAALTPSKLCCKLMQQYEPPNMMGPSLNSWKVGNAGRRAYSSYRRRWKASWLLPHLVQRGRARRQALFGCPGDCTALPKTLGPNATVTKLSPFSSPALESSPQACAIGSPSIHRPLGKCWSSPGISPISKPCRPCSCVHPSRPASSRAGAM